ncbi:Branched-chain-amino-acid aminotransferase [Aduncisulcus paluster]|uniref:Branched-chain-amino-acid aminotransferase n=1 Tax=Aduncisulcus paluster TaxID=2918883 RepID=A0ABQ5JZU8_9EUKA|nr:Branched-chain-amino-acid aminotransferase [Aduncisulcus paluster]
MYCDFCIDCTRLETDKAKKLLHTAFLDGYSIVAINFTFNDKPSAELAKEVLAPFSFFKQEGIFTLDDPALGEERRKREFLILSRITIDRESSSPNIIRIPKRQRRSNQPLPLADPGLRQFDLVSIVVRSDEDLKHAINSYIVDIITIDYSVFSYLRLKKGTVGKIIQQGQAIEVQYSSALIAPSPSPLCTSEFKRHLRTKFYTETCGSCGSGHPGKPFSGSVRDLQQKETNEYLTMAKKYSHSAEADKRAIGDAMMMQAKLDGDKIVELTSKSGPKDGISQEQISKKKKKQKKAVASTTDGGESLSTTSTSDFTVSFSNRSALFRLLFSLHSSLFSHPHIILSSGCRSEHSHRSPASIVSMCWLFGMNSQCSTKCISESCRNVMERALARKVPFGGVVAVPTRLSLLSPPKPKETIPSKKIDPSTSQEEITGGKRRSAEMLSTHKEWKSTLSIQNGPVKRVTYTDLRVSELRDPKHFLACCEYINAEILEEAGYVKPKIRMNCFTIRECNILTLFYILDIDHDRSPCTLDFCLDCIERLRIIKKFADSFVFIIMSCNSKIHEKCPDEFVQDIFKEGLKNLGLLLSKCEEALRIHKKIPRLMVNFKVRNYFAMMESASVFGGILFDFFQKGGLISPAKAFENVVEKFRCKIDSEVERSIFNTYITQVQRDDATLIAIGSDNKEEDREVDEDDDEEEEMLPCEAHRLYPSYSEDKLSMTNCGTSKGIFNFSHVLKKGEKGKDGPDSSTLDKILIHEDFWEKFLVQYVQTKKEYGKPKIYRIMQDIDFSKLEITLTKTPKTMPPKDDLLFGKHLSDHMLEIEWEEGKGWGEPRIVPQHDLVLSPAAQCFHYGMEVFEGLKAYKDEEGKARLFRPLLNFQRLKKSCERLSLPSFNPEEALKCMRKLVEVDQKWIPEMRGYSLYLRPTVVSTSCKLGLASPNKALMFVIMSPSGPYFASGFKPVSLYATTEFVRAWPGGVGSCKCGGNYAPTILPQKIAKEKGCNQVLWLFGEKNYVTEVGAMSFFVVIKDKETGKPEVITASLADGTILPSITRRSVIELVKSYPEYTMSERDCSMEEIVEAAKDGRLVESFGPGTAAIVVPINKILYEKDDIEIPCEMDGDCGRDCSMEEIVEAAKDGRLVESFGTGTAAIVVPINKILYEKDDIEIPCEMDGDCGVLTHKLFNTLLDIQFGVKEHEWSEFL